ncbi:cofilin-like protein, partial [Dinothrombium tinctorium]
SSGVTVSTNAKTAYEEIKKDKKYRYIIYHIKENKEIDVESTGDRNLTYNDFLNELMRLKDDCRYSVFDFPANIPVEGSQDTQSMSVDRLILLKWCPETAHVKQKMLYSSSYEALRRALVGIYKYIQASEFDEASLATIEDCIRSKAKN